MGGAIIIVFVCLDETRIFLLAARLGLYRAVVLCPEALPVFIELWQEGALN
jgi:hypothetical protein